ncbi:hypothetical protein [Acidisphaera sp. L21]|uniref:hypothetical protein n=1 Tax=Acidisphaera sp. L21 TaxID=1641851 RepID=UPI00131B93B6|nr:hypothetical protein [Acidisphaera sp. L21]
MGDIIGVAGRIRSQPVPETDRIAQRHRQEADTLVKPLRIDMSLAGHANLLRQTVRDQSPVWLVEHADEIKRQVAAITSALNDRAAILSGENEPAKLGLQVILAPTAEHGGDGEFDHQRHQHRAGPQGK